MRDCLRHQKASIIWAVRYREGLLAKGEQGGDGDGTASAAGAASWQCQHELCGMSLWQYSGKGAAKWLTGICLR